MPSFVPPPPDAAPLRDAGAPWLFPGGAARPVPHGVPHGALIAEIVALPARPTVLLHATGTGTLRRLTLRGDSGAGIAAEVETAAASVTLTVAWPPEGAGRAGLALGWDGAGVTLAAAPGGAVRLRAPGAATALALTLDAGSAAMLTGSATGLWTHPAVAWTALYTAPFRPLPAALLAPETRIDTPGGPRPLVALGRGDAVLTLDGTARIADAASRHLPMRGTFAPVRLRAGYCPIARDIVTGPLQGVLVDGFGVEDATGRDEILMRAADLAATRLAERVEGPDTMPMVSLRLDRPALIRAEGMAFAAAGPRPAPLATEAEAAAIVRHYRHRAVTR
jgi:hypothetical protein